MLHKIRLKSSPNRLNGKAIRFSYNLNALKRQTGSLKIDRSTAAILSVYRRFLNERLMATTYQYPFSDLTNRLHGRSPFITTFKRELS